MAIQHNGPAANSVSVTSDVDKTKPQPLDASKLVFTPAQALKALPDLSKPLSFGITQTDYMLVVEHDPATGWSTPEIKPYAPLPMDPMSSCFHYCPNVFEGMKVSLSSDTTTPKRQLTSFIGLPWPRRKTKDFQTRAQHAEAEDFRCPRRLASEFSRPFCPCHPRTWSVFLYAPFDALVTLYDTLADRIYSKTLVLISAALPFHHRA